jgi:RNA polymerase-binding transcription factor DksA
MIDQDAKLEELQRLRTRTLTDIERLRDELHAEIEPASATDDDSADVAADIYERGKIISLIQSLEAKLHAVDHAISIAAKGTYGICELCGVEILAERLAIMPETTLCVNCASKLEQGIRRHQILTRSSQIANLFDEEEPEEEPDESDDDV